MDATLRKSKTELRLTEYFASILRMPVEQVRADVNLLDLGADSIMLVEAQRWLQDQFGCTIEIRDFFENLNTIQNIATFLNQAKPPGNAVKPDLPKANSPGPAQPGKAARSKQQSVSGSQQGYALMLSQLQLAAETIEAQNQLVLAKLRGGTNFASVQSNNTQTGQQGK